MTSLILAQKLASINLCKEEYEKIKRVRMSTTGKSVKAINILKKIIKAQEVNKTCRLCLKPGMKKIFGKDTDFDVTVSIQHFLGVEVKENDGKPQHICNSCEATLKDVQQLKQTAEITQWRLQQELEMVSGTWLELDDEDSFPTHGGYFVAKKGQIGRQWFCQKCRRTFDDQAEFTDHEKQPSCRRSKWYICETCGLKLKTMARFKRHRLIHTGELRHACAVCPYRARTEYALSVHARTHSGARPLRCACGASFPSASNLASHRRTHRPPAHHCHHCQKSFRYKEVLRNHIASQHSTAKPHICATCGKAFSTRKMICRHERRVHNRPKLRTGMLPTYLRQEAVPGSIVCSQDL